MNVLFLPFMNLETLYKNILEKKSYLCVGLDSDINKIPKHLLSEENPILTFNKNIIEATKDYCIAYKINTAFYEAQGIEGWKNMQATFNMIPTTHLKIADAKRGDIGNTSDQYAIAFFDKMQADALTVAPYMGKDSLDAFLQYKNKWTIVLGLTSNKGAEDFELLQTQKDTFVFEEVLKKVSTWAETDQLMFVIGATQSDYIRRVRNIIPDYFLLVPGVGSQGGSLADISRLGFNSKVGLMVNASRSIIYAKNDEHYDQAAKTEAQNMQLEMENILMEHRFI